MASKREYGDIPRRFERNQECNVCGRVFRAATKYYHTCPKCKLNLEKAGVYGGLNERPDVYVSKEGTSRGDMRCL
jgi:predicted amidophosphoribosyltransferase